MVGSNELIARSAMERIYELSAMSYLIPLDADDVTLDQDIAEAVSQGRVVGGDDFTGVPVVNSVATHAEVFPGPEFTQRLGFRVVLSPG